MMARLLAIEGFVPVTAEGGEADFGCLAGAPLALVLVNTYRPDLTGAEVVARVSAFFPDVPVLHLEDSASSGSFDVAGLLQSVRTLTRTERRQVAR
jgi:DNA-binding response OmpR family regulator